MAPAKLFDVPCVTVPPLPKLVSTLPGGAAQAPASVTASTEAARSAPIAIFPTRIPAPPACRRRVRIRGSVDPFLPAGRPGWVAGQEPGGDQSGVVEAWAYGVGSTPGTTPSSALLLEP